MKKLTVKERLGIVWLVLFSGLIIILAAMNTIGGLNRRAVSDLPFYFWCLIAGLVILVLVIVPFIPLADTSKPNVRKSTPIDRVGRALLGIFIIWLGVSNALQGPANTILSVTEVICLLIVFIAAIVRARYNKRKLQ